jgi:hypothetical protein
VRRLYQITPQCTGHSDQSCHRIDASPPGPPPRPGKITIEINKSIYLNLFKIAGKWHKTDNNGTRVDKPCIRRASLPEIARSAVIVLSHGSNYFGNIKFLIALLKHWYSYLNSVWFDYTFILLIAVHKHLVLHSAFELAEYTSSR